MLTTRPPARAHRATHAASCAILCLCLGGTSLAPIRTALGVPDASGGAVAERADATRAVTTPEMVAWIYLPAIAMPPDPTKPRIFASHIPACEARDVLSGRVDGRVPPGAALAVYILVDGGYWSKPTFAAPLTPVMPDGTWRTVVVTGGLDHLATGYAVFLVPAGYSPPLRSGQPELPAELRRVALAALEIERPCSPDERSIAFSGSRWRVKASESPIGPGDNRFSDRQEDVWVDADGHLHMRLARHDGRWYATEVIDTVPRGYGTYRWVLGTDLGSLPPEPVVGMFTWDGNDPDQAYAELDVEIARWGGSGRAIDDKTAQFVVQPCRPPMRFTLGNATVTTHVIEWLPDRVRFGSYEGDAWPPDPAKAIAEWTYDQPCPIPTAGDGTARINLWLDQGQAPSGGREIEMVVRRFDHIPPARPETLSTKKLGEVR